MSNDISCPACGGPARKSLTQTNDFGEPALLAVPDAAKSERIVQLERTVKHQEERLAAANQHLRELEAAFAVVTAGLGSSGRPPSRAEHSTCARL